MKYSSTITVPLTSFPGATATLNRMSSGRRERFYIDNAELVDKHRGFTKRQMQLTRNKTRIEDGKSVPLPFADWPLEDWEKWMDLDEEFSSFTELQWKPAWVKWAVKSLNDVELDGAAADLATALEIGPVELIDELHDLVKQYCTLKVEAEKNSLSPSTFSAPVGGETKNGTARSASEMDGTSLPETVLVMPQNA